MAIQNTFLHVLENPNQCKVFPKECAILLINKGFVNIYNRYTYIKKGKIHVGN